LPALQALVKADQNDTATRLRLAFAEERSGNFNAAIEDYRRVVDDRPNDAPVLNNLAYDLAEYANRPDEALGYAQRAKELAPNVPAIDDTIGWVYYRKGLYNSALQYFRTATAKGSDPQFTPETLARCKFHLAMAYCRNGDHEQGQRAFDEAVKLAPQLPEAKVSRELLAALSQSRMK
jgi:tetratricopeptide (TPR) repeat protein